MTDLDISQVVIIVERILEPEKTQHRSGIGVKKMLARQNLSRNCC